MVGGARVPPPPPPQTSKITFCYLNTEENIKNIHQNVPFQTKSTVNIANMSLERTPPPPTFKAYQKLVQEGGACKKLALLTNIPLISNPGYACCMPKSLAASGISSFTTDSTIFTVHNCIHENYSVFQTINNS